METFKKVFIKSESDLPKESKDYFVGYKNGGIATVHWHNNIKSWLAFNDWYLLPLESSQKEPAEVSEEIIKKVISVYLLHKNESWEYINNEIDKILNCNKCREDLQSLPQSQEAKVTDEDIEDRIKELPYEGEDFESKQVSYYEGAKWMREQLSGQIPAKQKTDKIILTDENSEIFNKLS